jgi:5-methylthioribose kinase
VELSLKTVTAYLAARGLEPSHCRELGGGVSNIVILANTSRGSIVLKQALGKLRVEQDWFSDRERIHRECEAMRMLAPILPQGSIPEIVFEDRDNCIFAMTAVPEPALPLKSILMDGGELNPLTMENIARLLADLIHSTAGNKDFQNKFGDLRVFDQLRLDPYYRATAARHPDLKGFFDDLIHETVERRYSLVHGDLSPKNLLVSSAQVTLIDFEVIHYGDPAFDIAFFINHLLLKSVYLQNRQLKVAALEFCGLLQSMVREPWLESAVIRHLGALMLARVDGKSPVEYIHGTALEPRVREMARGIILRPSKSIAETIESV